MQDGPGRSLSDSQWQADWGRLLRTARQVAGLSLTALSDMTGLSKGYLSKLESGHIAAANPSRATLAALARALPSFRPLAHSLDPSVQLGSLALGSRVPQLQLNERDESEENAEPVQLGWRELEVALTVMTFEEGAVLEPISALLVSRALTRPRDEVETTLAQLTAMRLLDRRMPASRGQPVTYRRSVHFEAKLGLSRIGDALILAAALLSRAPVQHRNPKSERDLLDEDE